MSFELYFNKIFTVSLETLNLAFHDKPTSVFPYTVTLITGHSNLVANFA